MNDEARLLQLTRERNEIELRRWARGEVVANPEWARQIANALLDALTAGNQAK